MGRMIRPVRMRPERPLPPQTQTTLSRPSKSAKDGKAKEGLDKKKKKRAREPDVRARRKTIDPTRWDSIHLKGMFLDVITAPPERVQEPEDNEQSSGSSSDDTDGSDLGDIAESALAQPVLNLTKKRSRSLTPIPQPHPESTSEPALLVDKSLLQSSPHPKSIVSTSSVIDLNLEKTTSLSLLHTLFGSLDNEDEWEGRESVGSDIGEDEVERLMREGGRAGGASVEEVEVEEVPMEVDHPVRVGTDIIDEIEVDDAMAKEAEEQETASEPPPEPEPEPAVEKWTIPAQATKLKDLFAPREEEGTFSSSLGLHHYWLIKIYGCSRILSPRAPRTRSRARRRTRYPRFHAVYRCIYHRPRPASPTSTITSDINFPNYLIPRFPIHI